MFADATEVKNNFSRFLALSQKEDVLIRKRGKVVAVLKNPLTVEGYVVDSLVGILPENFDEKSMRIQRMERHLK
jgi:hypothetical protein